MVAVPIVAHIVGAVFDPETLISGSPGVILAPLGSILVALGSLGLHFGSLGLHFGGLGLPGDPTGIPIRKREVFRRFGALHLGTHVGTFSHKNHKNIIIGVFLWGLDPVPVLGGKLWKN